MCENCTFKYDWSEIVQIFLHSLFDSWYNKRDEDVSFIKHVHISLSCITTWMNERTSDTIRKNFCFTESSRCRRSCHWYFARLSMHFACMLHRERCTRACHSFFPWNIKQRTWLPRTLTCTYTGRVFSPAVALNLRSNLQFKSPARCI